MVTSVKNQNIQQNALEYFTREENATFNYV
jgi:hypothetical protein